MTYEWDAASHDEYRKEDPSRVCTRDGPQSANEDPSRVCTRDGLPSANKPVIYIYMYMYEPKYSDDGNDVNVGMFVLMMFAVIASLSCESLRLTSSRLPPEVLLKELPKSDKH